MRTPMDILFDQVDWHCTRCGVSTRVGCGCLDRTTPAQRQQVAYRCRRVFRDHLKVHCPLVWESRSARASLGNRLYNAIEGALERLDRDAPTERRGLLPAEADEVVNAACYDVEGYWMDLYPTEYASVAPAFLARFWQDVERVLRAVLAEQVGTDAATARGRLPACE